MKEMSRQITSQLLRFIIKLKISFSKSVINDYYGRVFLSVYCQFSADSQFLLYPAELSPYLPV